MRDNPDLADGVYFALPAETYHRVPALSASGIKNLLISGPDFWYRCPWLNPNYIDENTEAMAIGRAYHKRILEGRAAFYDEYAAEFQAPDDCLRTIDDIREAIRNYGQKPTGTKKADLIEQIIAINPATVILDELRADYETEHHGKEFLSADLILKVEMAAKMIECHPEIGKCFTGGYPEVSVIWTENDIRFKARFDYLKPRAIVDLKTFGNFLNKPIDNAIYSSMASGKYHVQAAFYMRAFQVARSLTPFGPDISLEWFEQLCACDEPGFYFTFQQKGVAPLARCKKFTKGSLWSCGEVAIDEAIIRFKANMKKFGDLPWIDDTPIDEFRDDQFPVYTTEL